MINKNLVITVENNEEGTTLSLKTVTGGKSILITGDHSSYNLDDLKKALTELSMFLENRDNVTYERC